MSFLVCSLYILVFSAKISHFSGKVVSVVVDTAVYAYPEGLTYGMEIEHEGNRRYVKTPPVRGLQQTDGLMNLVGQEVYVTYWNTKNFYPKGKKSPQYMAQKRRPSLLGHSIISLQNANGEELPKGRPICDGHTFHWTLYVLILSLLVAVVSIFLLRKVKREITAKREEYNKMKNKQGVFLNNSKVFLHFTDADCKLQQKHLTEQFNQVIDSSCPIWFSVTDYAGNSFQVLNHKFIVGGQIHSFCSGHTLSDSMISFPFMTKSSWKIELEVLDEYELLYVVCIPQKRKWESKL